MLNVGKGVASAVKDPGATAKGVGTGVKRFGTNLGRKAKRTGDKAVDSVASDDDKKAEGSEKSTTDKAAAAGTGMAYSMLGVNKAAREVGAEGRGRSLHHEPDPQEGAHRHRPDRRRRAASRRRSWCRSRWS